MKIALLVLAFIVFAASCRKTVCPVPPTSLSNTEWISKDDATFKLAFTSDVVVLSYPHLTPSTEAAQYIRLGGDTVSIPSMPAMWVLTVRGDSLYFTNVKNGGKMTLYRHY